MEPSEAPRCFLNSKTVLFCLVHITLLLPVALVEGEVGDVLHNPLVLKRLGGETNVVALKDDQERFIEGNTRVKRDHRQRRNVQPTTGFPSGQFQTARLTTGWGLKRTTSGLPLARTGITQGFRRQTTRGYGGVAGNHPFGGSTRWSPMHTNPPNLIPRRPDSGGPNDIDPVDEESSPKITDRNRNIIIGAVAGGVFILVIVFIGVAILIIRRRKERSEEDEENDIKMAPIPPPRVFNSSLSGDKYDTKEPKLYSNSSYEEM